MDNNPLTLLDSYYKKQETMIRECLFALKSIIMSVYDNIRHIRKYQIPFSCYKEFNIVFLWVNNKKIIVGFIDDKKTIGQATTGKKKR